MERLQKIGFHAKRMGGTTSFFPDVIATRNDTITKCLAIECKATAYPIISLKTHDVIKCFEILKMFSIYQEQYSILACKFLSVFKNTGFKRPIKEHYYIMDQYVDQCSEYPFIAVRYDGTIGFTRDKKFYQINPPTATFLNNSLSLPIWQSRMIPVMKPRQLKII